jgi:hypothetical protein
VPIIKKATLQIESKLQRQRKKSACFSEALFDKELADSQSEDSADESTNSLFNDHYTIGDKIGEGAHGVVRKCYSKESGQLLAAKTFRVDREHIIFLKQNFIDIKKLQHPNIIGYKALFFEMNSEKCHLVMDYLPYPDLNQIPIKTEHVPLSTPSVSKKSHTRLCPPSPTSTLTKSATGTSNPKTSSTTRPGIASSSSTSASAKN